MEEGFKTVLLGQQRREDVAWQLCTLSTCSLFNYGFFPLHLEQVTYWLFSCIYILVYVVTPVNKTPWFCNLTKICRPATFQFTSCSGPVTTQV